MMDYSAFEEPKGPDVRKSVAEQIGQLVLTNLELHAEVQRLNLRTSSLEAALKTLQPTPAPASDPAPE